MENQILNSALEYLSKGWSVIPVGKNKIPLIEWKDFQTRLAVVEEVQNWWAKWPEANVGVVTGRVSGITVVDVESGGETKDLPATYIVKTGNGGWHFYYQYAEMRNKTRIRELTDIRGEGGYVVAPPSITDYLDEKTGARKGGPYELVADSGLADFPVDLFLVENEGYKPLLNPLEYLGLPDGERNASLHRLACSLLTKYSDYEAWIMLSEFNKTARPPKPEEEVRILFESARKFIGQNKKTNFVAPSFSSGGERKRKAIIARLSDIQPEEVQWLWPGRVALGKLTLISGDPGLGKSLLTTTIAAAVSKGYQWPVDGGEAPMGDVLLLSAEDEAADTIRPRLDAAQADCSRIYIIQSIEIVDEEGKQVRSLFSLKKDIETLDSLLGELPDCKMVVIDPISAYLDSTDSHKNADVRALLAPLNDLAAKHKVSVVLVSHFNKAGGANAIYRTMGSLAFTAAVRAAYIVTKDPENPARKLFMPAKNNLAADMGGLAYSIVEAEKGSIVIAWENEPVSMTADEALVPFEQDGERTATDEAKNFLRDYLVGGPRKVSEVQKEAKQAGISEKPLRCAREKLGVKSKKLDFAGGWVWALPEDAQNSEDAKSKKEGILGGEGHLRSAREEDLPAMAYLKEKNLDLFKQE